MGEREFRHIIVYHPDRLMRQPRNLEELLTISDEHQILLHGETNRRNLSDPDDRSSSASRWPTPAGRPTTRRGG
ncbi:hypothetical protein [Kitasatospora sp. NPDC087271]|uniref:hypothetical protein n=1 Tax=Kitasatospora sp. NPDC087271 TaxID=3364067 RepID=UPI003819E3CF